MKSHDYASLCPNCGYHAEAASGVTGPQAPEPGDVSFCIKCGEIGIFDPVQRLRKPTAAEQVELNADPKIQDIRTAWKLMRRNL